MGILSNYRLVNAQLRNNESYNNFRNETDTSRIVRLKCPSYCQFYMHIISNHRALYVIFPYL